MMNKMMKKLAAAFLAGAMAVTAAGVIAHANDGMGVDTMNVSVSAYNGVGYITSSTANVRTAPSTDNRILETLSCGDEIYFDGYTSNGWYRIETSDPVYGGLTCGYIYSGLVSEGSVGNAYMYEEESTYSYTATVNVASGYLALRNSPNWTDDNSNVIEEMYNGQKFTITEYHGQYVYGFSNATGRCGYANVDYLY